MDLHFSNAKRKKQKSLAVGDYLIIVTENILVLYFHPYQTKNNWDHINLLLISSECAPKHLSKGFKPSQLAILHMTQVVKKDFDDSINSTTIINF